MAFIQCLGVTFGWRFSYTMAISEVSWIIWSMGVPVSCFSFMSVAMLGGGLPRSV